MSRIRSIKPELTLDEELAQLSVADRYFFINLWCHCDRSGRAEDRPSKLKVLIHPWDDVDVDAILDRLSPKFVLRYEVKGRKYLQVRAFEKHQRPNVKESPSEMPAPPKSCKHVKKHASTLDKGVGKGGGKGMDIVPASPPPDGVLASPSKITPIQAVIRAFKEAKGIDADDKSWDHNFPRYTKAARELLLSFLGNTEAAVAFVVACGMKWDEAGNLGDWGLDGIVKAASRRHAEIQEVVKNGQPSGTMGAARLVGSDRRRGITPAGEIAGEALDGLRRELE